MLLSITAVVSNSEPKPEQPDLHVMKDSTQTGEFLILPQWTNQPREKTNPIVI